VRVRFKKRKNNVILSEYEVEKLINGIDLSKPTGRRNKAIVEMLYYCGLKISELVNLKMSNLHFKKGIIEVVGKNGRMIPACDSVEEAVRCYIKYERKGLRIKPGDEEFVFLSCWGKKLERINICLLVKAFSKKVELGKEVSPQVLRNSFGVRLLESGVDIKSVQEFLGHTSLVATEILARCVRK
jgi:integrase/recombinase XerD